MITLSEVFFTWKIKNFNLKTEIFTNLDKI